MSELRAIDRRIIALKSKEIETQRLRLKILRESYVWKFKPYQWQKVWWHAGRYNKQRLLMAANQVGKTFGSCAELCYHLTGRYPADWAGYQFHQPINAWALGVSYEQIKKVLQKTILGSIIDTNNNFDGGLIPNRLIYHPSIVKGQLRNSVKEIKILYEGGGQSTLSFLSYEQGQAALMGAIVDVALIDEEPRDPEIYPQVLTRTINGDQKRGGLVMLSFTPELGTTTLVEQFTNHLQPGQYLQTVTWEDAPHLTKERKEQMLAAIPEYQRDMRSKGIPQLGSGAIYPIPDEDLYDTTPEILDHWPRICGMDFGWKYTALVWCAWDRDADVLHVYDALKLEELRTSEIYLKIRSRGEWIPIAWPHDGHMKERNEGKAQKDIYVEHGAAMLDEHATDTKGETSVEAGIKRVYDRMRDDKLKIAAHLSDLFAEKRLYHRKDGKIVKANDHLLDALRYAEMMLRYSRTKDSLHRSRLRPSYRGRIK